MSKRRGASYTPEPDSTTPSMLLLKSSLRQPLAPGRLEAATLQWPAVGKRLWRAAEPGKKPVVVYVTAVFWGQDQRSWCVVEHRKRGRVLRYETVPLLGLQASPLGPSYLQVALRDPEFATAFLKRAGLLTRGGNLPRRYGGR